MVSVCYDVVVVGSGGAGLTAALPAAEFGLPTAVIERATRASGPAIPVRGRRGGGLTLTTVSGFIAGEMLDLDHGLWAEWAARATTVPA